MSGYKILIIDLTDSEETITYDADDFILQFKKQGDSDYEGIIQGGSIEDVHGAGKTLIDYAFNECSECDLDLTEEAKELKNRLAYIVKNIVIEIDAGNDGAIKK
jgi:hypothetical protein